MSSGKEAAAAMNNSGTAQNLAGGYNSQAAQNGGFLSSQFKNMATNPTGLGQQGIADANTAAMQSYGGSQAGTVGQANQMAARTNNAGGYSAALDDASRSASSGLSDAALGIQNMNNQIKLGQQQEGLSGLQGMYGTQVGAGENALGLSNSAIGQATQANQQTLGALMAPFQVAAGLGSTAAGLGVRVPGCWIAEALYGFSDPRTYVVRAYLNGPFRSTSFGDWLMRLYLRHGERVAAVVRRSRFLRTILRPLFDRALSDAVQPLFALPLLVEAPHSEESRRRLITMFRPGPKPLPVPPADSAFLQEKAS